MKVPLSRLMFLALVWVTCVALGESPYLYLFESAVERARFAQGAQTARQALTDAQYQRASYLLSKNALSREEFEQTKAAALIAEFDVKIAEVIVRQQQIGLRLAQSLGGAGRRIPVCRRRKKRPQPALLKILKTTRTPLPPQFEEARPGTEVRLAEVPRPPPEPPPQPSPPEPPSPIEPPAPPPIDDVPSPPPAPAPGPG